MQNLPLPEHFIQENADKIYKVDYQAIANSAYIYAKKHNINPSCSDTNRICLVIVDVQNTFCIPGFELFVAGRSGKDAVIDSIRLCKFIYNNLDRLTDIIPTMDTHFAMQIFHQIFFIDKDGNHPRPMTLITCEDLISKKYRVNPEVAKSLNNHSYDDIEKYVLYYVKMLKQKSKYDLVIWPYHAILGGIGHCLVSIVEEAIFFHNTARYSQSHFEVKGSDPLSENYSIFRPEVMANMDCEPVQGDTSLFDRLLKYDKIIFAGQAKSHCLAWSIGDLQEYIQKKDISLAKKVYILEDCTSPVVVPGVFDFTEISNNTFNKFRDFGFNLVSSQVPIDSWL